MIVYEYDTFFVSSTPSIDIGKKGLPLIMSQIDELIIAVNINFKNITYSKKDTYVFFVL